VVQKTTIKKGINDEKQADQLIELLYPKLPKQRTNRNENIS
jgi:hypothetical protein